MKALGSDVQAEVGLAGPHPERRPWVVGRRAESRRQMPVPGET